MAYRKLKAALALQLIAWHGLSRLTRDGLPLTAANLSKVTELSHPRCVGYFSSFAREGYLVGVYPNQVLIKHPTKPCPPMPQNARVWVSKPKPDRKPVPAMRRCLFCGKERVSEGPWDRFHSACRETVNARSATMEGM